MIMQSESVKRTCGDSEVSEIWSRYKETGQVADRNELVKHYLPLVHGCAARQSRRLPLSVESDDLVSAGTFGLIQAIDAFTPDRGVTFSAFCQHRIRGAILDELRSMDWVPRHTRQCMRRIEDARSRLRNQNGEKPSDEQLARSAQVPARTVARAGRSPQFFSFDQPIGHDGAGNEVSALDSVACTKSESGLSAAQRKELKVAITRGLSRSERLVIVLYYYEGMTLREVGATLSISESRVSQIVNGILRRLREHFSRTSHWE